MHLDSMGSCKEWCESVVGCVAIVYEPGRTLCKILFSTKENGRSFEYAPGTEYLERKCRPVTTVKCTIIYDHLFPVVGMLAI